MPSMEENLLRHGLRRVAERMAPKDEAAMALRSEVGLYDSPHWAEFQKGLEGRLVVALWELVDEDDPVQVRVIQRDCRRLREQIRRPEMALQELQQLNAELDEERRSALAAAGLRANGASRAGKGAAHP